MALNTPSATDIRIVLSRMEGRTMAQNRSVLRQKVKALEAAQYALADQERMVRATLLAFEHKYPGVNPF